jgi:hypothetical protein
VEIKVMESFVKMKEMGLKFHVEERNYIHSNTLIYSFLTRNFQFLTSTFNSFIKYGGGAENDIEVSGENQCENSRRERKLGI